MSSRNHKEKRRQPGVSVVICCYNSALRLPKALHHLLAQTPPASIPWEVLVINNASTDDTVAVAKAQWPSDAPAPLRIVDESQPGLIYARERGIKEAHYEYINFIDDDNWVAPGWVEIIFDVMHNHPEVAACGGRIDAAPEETPPAWFERYQNNYAVGTYERAGDITDHRVWLLGAGITVRNKAIQDLRAHGFVSRLTGRKGKSLSAGEEFELCFALVMAGWRLWYEPRLSLQHFIPRQRLTWDYLRRLHRGFGRTTVVHEIYLAQMREEGNAASRSWWREGGRALKKVVYYYFDALRDAESTRASGFEGCHAIINYEHKIGRLYELWQRKGTYDRSVEELGALYTRLAAYARAQAPPLQTTSKRPPAIVHENPAGFEG